MKNKELCILIILLILLGIVIMVLKRTNYIELSLYDKANIIIDCEEKEKIVCKTSYNFQDDIENLSFFIDYGSGLELVNVDNVGNFNYDGNYYFINKLNRINNNAFIMYFKTNTNVNETNKYVAFRNINFMINNKRYYINDVYYIIK